MIRLISILINGLALLYLMLKCHFQLLEAAIILIPVIVFNYWDGYKKAIGNKRK